MQLYEEIRPTHTVPLVLSIPHAGRYVPSEILEELNPTLFDRPGDEDLHVDQLYDFASHLGIITLQATHSRWVVDLNRNPSGTPLYNDGRMTTGVCPVQNFHGNWLYEDQRKSLRAEEQHARLHTYYHPYHNRLQVVLAEVKEKFGKVLLWEAHSISRNVPMLYKQPLPDLILGDAEGQSASPNLIDIAYGCLQGHGFEVRHNHPFQGGYITRFYGKPLEKQHVLQLELCKDLYLSDDLLSFSRRKAQKLQDVIKNTLNSLIDYLLTHAA